MAIKFAPPVAPEAQVPLPALPPALSLTPSSANRSRLWIAAEWLLLLLLTALVLNWLLVSNNAPHQPDFRAFFYPAAKLVAHGLSPYDFEVTEAQSGFVYPPHLALLLAPLGFLPYPLAADLWEIFNLALLAITLRMSEYIVGLDLGWLRRTIVYLALLLWAPVHMHFILGSCSLIVAASLTGALLAIQRNRLWLAGFLLAVSAVKPQLVFLLGAGLVLRAWRAERSVKLLLTGPLSLAGALLATYVVAPTWPATLFAHPHDVYDYWGCTTNLRTLLATPSGHNWLTEGIFWAVCIAACGWLLLRWADPASDLTVLSSLTLTWTLLATPYAQGYDYVILVLPLLLVLARISVEPPHRRPWLFLSLALGTWISGSLDRWFYGWLAWGSVWKTLSHWFGEDWVAAVWQSTKWDYRFLVMLVPLGLTVVLQRWPPKTAKRPERVPLTHGDARQPAPDS